VKGLVLYLPVFLGGFPLLVYLLSSPPPSDGTKASDFSLPEVAATDAPPDEAQMERLAATDPVAFLEHCLGRYNREVHGYHLTMQKQERIGNQLHDKELVDVYFKEHPHSVFLIWIAGSLNAERTLYVEDETNPDKKILARPSSALNRRLLGNIVEQDVNGILARQAGRFTLDKFGIKKATQRYLASWKAAREQGILDVTFLGIHRLPEANNQLVYHIHRKCAVPENDGVTEQTLYIDKATWLQVGSVIKGKGGQLIGEYYFRDIQLNPPFKPNQFQRDALTP
jgi:hypothetical protein